MLAKNEQKMLQTKERSEEEEKKIKMRKLNMKIRNIFC